MKPIRDRHAVEPENAEDRAVIAAKAKSTMACRTEAGASTSARRTIADAFGPAWADRAVARGGQAMVFRGDGRSQPI